MKKLLAFLGLQYGEVFVVHNEKYRFVENGSSCIEIDEGGVWVAVQPVILEIFVFSLVTGQVDIRKVSLKPCYDDIYWYVEDENDVDYGVWCDSCRDYGNFFIGNCFRTKEEALANRDNIMHKLKKYYEKGEE